jgi:phosphoribosylglycinamide formyltransferase-1
MTETYAIFASGSGSNAMSLIEMGMSLNHDPSFLFVNKKDAAVINKAESRGVKVIVIETEHPKVDLEFELKLLDLCKQYNVKWVFLAGFMKILGKTFLENFKGDGFYRVINIHPSLLPKYKGLNGYEKAYVANDKEYGFSIHLVDEKIDHGEILYQRIILRDKKDSLEDFKSRGLTLENKDYPLVFKNILINKEKFITECLNKNSIRTQGNNYDK